jgi:probable rRNA maturation factor
MPGEMMLNQQRQVRVKLAGLGAFAAEACRALGLRPESLTVCMASTARMARWNLAYRGKRGATDVLSFPSDPAKPAPAAARRKRSKDAYLGDIAICPAVARRNARGLGRTLDSELRILILHGILHLMGYDHESDTGQMERRERRLRRALGLG